MGKSSFIGEERATVYYLNIAFLLSGTWTTGVKSSCGCLKICKLAWNGYFSVVNTDELNDKFYLHVAVLTEFPEELSSKWCQLLAKKKFVALTVQAESKERVSIFKLGQDCPEEAGAECDFK